MRLSASSEKAAIRPTFFTSPATSLSPCRVDSGGRCSNGASGWSERVRSSLPSRSVRRRRVDVNRAIRMPLGSRTRNGSSPLVDGEHRRAFIEPSVQVSPLPVAQSLRGRVELESGIDDVVMRECSNGGRDTGEVALISGGTLSFVRHPSIRIGPQREFVCRASVRCGTHGKNDGNDSPQEERHERCPTPRPPAPCSAEQTCGADTPPRQAGPESVRPADSA